MNLVEALKTGKPLRRPIEKHWGSCRSGYLGNQFVRDLLVGDKTVGLYSHIQQQRFITETDLLADDWMVAPETDNR